MLRLRTTTGLSVLALAIGIAGTGWLSTLTSGWAGPPPRVAVAATPSTPAHHARAMLRRVAAVRAAPVRAVARQPVAAGDGGFAEAQAAVVAPPPTLVPLSMPSDDSARWDDVRGHLNGRVVLHVSIDGNGKVSDASVAESSGDPTLDARALRNVRGWRFAVPADHPDGFSADLPMRFSSRGDRVARVL